MGNNGQGSGASAAADGYVCQRPKPEERHFTSKAVEEVIAGTKKKLKDPKLAWMFENCFPNTLDTTVNFKMIDGKPDTFVITGDIDAMWLRDSGAQVWPYVALCKKDEQLRLLIAGVINRQTKLIPVSYTHLVKKDCNDRKSTDFHVRVTISDDLFPALFLALFKHSFGGTPNCSLKHFVT